MHSAENNRKSALGKFNGKIIVPLVYKDVIPMGISPRNVGQKFMLEALMTSAKEVPLAIIKGPAGTAKTLFSLAVGLHKILENEEESIEEF